jgi:hypothetical protein
MLLPVWGNPLVAFLLHYRVCSEKGNMAGFHISISFHKIYNSASFQEMMEYTKTITQRTTQKHFLKTSFLFILTILIITILTAINLPAAFAADVECPFGLVNDTAPGNCRLYTDSDGNELCDLSEPHNCIDDQAVIDNPDYLDLIDGSTLKTMTVSEVAKTYGIDSKLFAGAISKYAGINVNENDLFQLLHDNYGVKPGAVKDIASSIKAGKEISTSALLKSEEASQSYNLLAITIITVLLYILTSILQKTGKISLMMHRKFWNWILLISFAATSLLAIVWLLNIEYHLGINLGLNTSYWHIETGIVMIIASIFHAAWHARYYLFNSKSR